jgi:transposase
MYLKCHTRTKDGKQHRYWSIAEKRRRQNGKRFEHHVLYLGEINDQEREAWTQRIAVFDEEKGQTRQLALFPADREIPKHATQDGIQIRLDEFSLQRPREWGACWVFCRLWQMLELDGFWASRLSDSRKGTCWLDVLKVLCANRLIHPSSEWYVHREWFDHSAIGDLLGADPAVSVKDTLYRCLDQLPAHKDALFQHLRERWVDLFNVSFDVLLYDLTSTYFESEPIFSEKDKRKFGYSRDHRSDCVQVVVALVVTPEGFPIGYEVMPGNTADCTTLRLFLDKIEELYGKARRVWLMDRGIPTEETLAELRRRGGQYVVGTPKGRLSKFEASLAQCSWQEARENVRVKLWPEGEELYVFVESRSRVGKERAMRRRRLKRLLDRLADLSVRPLPYEILLQKIGAARHEAGRDARLVDVALPPPPSRGNRRALVTFTYSLNKPKLRETCRREGRYLLRSNMLSDSPAKLWEFYLQLVEVEETFRTLKGDLEIRPIFHQEMGRVEAHLFVAFLAYCLHVTLKKLLQPHACGLTPRQVLDKFAAIQMLDVHFPTTDGRELIFRRYTKPEPDQQLLLNTLGWELPRQSPPRITAKGTIEK